MFAKLVGGSMQWPIASSLPRLNSPFNLDNWTDSLRDCFDPAIVEDLLHDITLFSQFSAVCSQTASHERLHEVVSSDLERSIFAEY